jgi:uncharacterized Fe-S cluster-containing radical SAM superfamily protein
MDFVELYTVMPVIICESFHDVNCLKLTNCILEFCLEIGDVIKFLFPENHLKFWANKDHVANLVSTKGMEQQSFYFLTRNSGGDKAE